MDSFKNLQVGDIIGDQVGDTIGDQVGGDTVGVDGIMENDFGSKLQQKVLDSL